MGSENDNVFVMHNMVDQSLTHVYKCVKLVSKKVGILNINILGLFSICTLLGIIHSTYIPKSSEKYAFSVELGEVEQIFLTYKGGCNGSDISKLRTISDI